MYICKYVYFVYWCWVMQPRYDVNLKLEERCCFNCSNLIEDETHVILRCPVYSDFRNNLFTEVLKVNRNVLSLSDCQKIVFLFSKMFLE